MRAPLLGTALVLAACVASSNEGPNAKSTTASGSPAKSRLICKEETPTGSSLSRTVCRTPEQVEEDRQGADDMLRKQNSRPAFDSK